MNPGECYHWCGGRGGGVLMVGLRMEIKNNDNNSIIMSNTCIVFKICQCSKCFLIFSSFNPHKSIGSY